MCTLVCFYRILQVLCTNTHLSSDVDLRKLAKRTPGYVGTDLRSLLNKAQIARNRRLVLFESYLYNGYFLAACRASSIMYTR